MKTSKQVLAAAIGLIFFVAGHGHFKAANAGELDPMLNVAVFGYATEGTITISADVVYVVNGEEMSKQFTQEFGDGGSILKAFRGEYIKSCTVEITEGEGWMKVTISKGGESLETLFESGKVMSTDPPVAYPPEE